MVVLLGMALLAAISSIVLLVQYTWAENYRERVFASISSLVAPTEADTRLLSEHTWYCLTLPSIAWFTISGLQLLVTGFCPRYFTKATWLCLALSSMLLLLGLVSILDHATSFID